MDLALIQIIFLSTFTVFSFIAFFFFISVFTGAPYVPTPSEKVKKMMEYAKIKTGEKVVDLGSGDGRLVIEAAKQGAISYGVEINPGLVVYSWLKIMQNDLKNKAKVHWGTLYRVNFSEYDVIFVAGFIEMMKKLEIIFAKKLKKGTRVICYAFPLPNIKPKSSENGIYLYQY